MSTREVVVVTGAGGMGHAIARRIGTGRRVVIADASESQLAAAEAELRAAGHDVHAVRVDVSSPGEVADLARRAAALGGLRCVVHTAGVSPEQAAAQQIVAIDVIGTALILDAFEAYAQQGTVAVCIASMAGTITDVDPATMQSFATTRTEKLHTLAALDPTTMEPATAYGVAKRANQARVEAASVAWGRRGARVVSVSPGIISTPMGQAELNGAFGGIMRSMIDMSGTGRIGTPDDIAAVVEFLVSPAASFITGTDILVDGGVVAAMRYPLEPTP